MTRCGACSRSRARASSASPRTTSTRRRVATWQAALVGVAAADPAQRRAPARREPRRARTGHGRVPGWLVLAVPRGTRTEPRRAGGEGRRPTPGLLRSPVRTTVSFAVAALDTLARASRLPSDGVIDRLGVALSGESAGTARSALRILERAGDRRPAQRPGDRGRHGRGARHAAPEVQAASLRAPRAIGRSRVTEPRGRPAARRRAPSMPPNERRSRRSWRVSIRGRRQPTLEATAPGPRHDRTATPATAAPVDPLDPSRAIDPDRRPRRARRGAHRRDRDRRPGRRRRARARWRQSPGTERAGLRAPDARRSRNGRERSWHDAGIAAIRGPTWRRSSCAGPTARSSSSPPFTGRAPSSRPGSRRSPSAPPRESRVRCSRLRPTPAAGIDPRVLVERLASWPSGESAGRRRRRRGVPAPGDRPAARRRSQRRSDLPGEVADALRHALGGGREVGPTAALWVAAARARDPATTTRRWTHGTRASGRTPRLAARIEVVTGQHRNDIDRVMYPMGLALSLEPPLPASPPTDMPTVLLLVDEGWWSYEPGTNVERLRWEATIWPAWREIWAAIGDGRPRAQPRLVERRVAEPRPTSSRSSIRG